MQKYSCTPTGVFHLLESAFPTIKLCMPLTMWFILLSGILKVTYKGTVQAEAKEAQATEVAESESLKRQVVEARMAAMQAQVEPHFLFNTLASIDHLIETDPPRASLMQKNLIALLRASMPSMREANAQGSTRDLGKELAVIRPYLEALPADRWQMVESAVDRGLRWLSTQQQPDGSFSGAEVSQPAVTCFAVMAFLSRGHVPDQGTYGRNLTRAIDGIELLAGAAKRLIESGSLKRVMK